MKEFAFRLSKNEDLKKSIEEKCKQESINTAIVLCSVGSIKHIKIRLAKAKEYLDINNDFEIISLNGTISNGIAHLHISVSDDKGSFLGGHLCEGTIINTTCELVLGVLDEYESNREYDALSGYNEIVFRKKEQK